MAHEFKHPKYYRRKNMSISKRLEGRSDGSEKEKLMKLASETGDEEFILDLSTGLLKEFEEAVKQNPKLKKYLTTKNVIIKRLVK